MAVVESVIDLIGNTPLLLLKNPEGVDSSIKVYGKLEYMNPGGSVKDRTALGMILDAEERGLLKPGYSMVESTSGNLGHSLAMIAAVRGYHFISVVDPKTPPDNIKIFERLGAEVEMLTVPDENGGFQIPRLHRAREIAATRPNCINLDQCGNPSAQMIHYRTTGPEIYKQMDGKVDVFVANASTGSHLSGTARYLKEVNPNIVVIGTEPEGSVIFGGAFAPYLQNGSGLSFVPGNYDPAVVDLKLKVSDKDAFTTVRQVARDNGVFFGGSSGAALYEAFNYAKQCTCPTNIVVILPDGGAKYMDTVYNDDWLREKGFLPSTPVSLDKKPPPPGGARHLVLVS